MKQRRLHLPYTTVGWTGHVMFSDEASFLFLILRVWMKLSERFAKKLCPEYRGGSVMVWAGICMDNHTQLVILDGNLNRHSYIAEVLQPHVVPHRC